MSQYPTLSYVPAVPFNTTLALCTRTAALASSKNKLWSMFAITPNIMLLSTRSTPVDRNKMGIPDWLHTKVYQIFRKLLTLQRRVNTVGTKKILELNPSIETGSPFYYDQGPWTAWVF